MLFCIFSRKKYRKTITLQVIILLSGLGYFFYLKEEEKKRFSSEIYDFKITDAYFYEHTFSTGFLGLGKRVTKIEKDSSDYYFRDHGEVLLFGTYIYPFKIINDTVFVIDKSEFKEKETHFAVSRANKVYRYDYDEEKYIHLEGMKYELFEDKVEEEQKR